MKRIAIIGSGHLGQQILHLIHTDTEHEVVGFYDDFALPGTVINGTRVLGKLDIIHSDFLENRFDELIIGIGYNHLAFKGALFERFSAVNIPFFTFIHSSCLIDSSAIIGSGVVIYPGTVVDQKVTIEDNVLINLSVTISHDSKIGAHGFIAPAVAIAGFVHIGPYCMLGIQSTVIDNITLGSFVTLGGGAVVVKNIDKRGIYIGHPAKFLRES